MEKELLKEITEKWKLRAYGKIIRGDEDTSEDQLASVVDEELAQLLVYRFNIYWGLVKEIEILKDIIRDQETYIDSLEIDAIEEDS